MAASMLDLEWFWPITIASSLASLAKTLRPLRLDTRFCRWIPGSSSGVRSPLPCRCHISPCRCSQICPACWKALCSSWSSPWCGTETPRLVGESLEPKQRSPRKIRDLLRLIFRNCGLDMSWLWFQIKSLLILTYCRCLARDADRLQS